MEFPVYHVRRAGGGDISHTQQIRRLGCVTPYNLKISPPCYHMMSVR